MVRFDGANDFLTFNLPVNGLGGMSIFLVAANTANQGGGDAAPERGVVLERDGVVGDGVSESVPVGVNFRFGTTQTGNSMQFTPGRRRWGAPSP